MPQFMVRLDDDQDEPERVEGRYLSHPEAAQLHLDAIVIRARVAETTITTEQIGAFPASRYRFSVVNGVVDVASAVAI